jgi:protein SCO1/2
MKLFHTLWLPVVVMSLVLLGCRTGSDAPKEKLYDVKGGVVSVDTNKPSVKLDHQDIPGLMKGMVMDFEVASPKVLDGLKPGDKVQGRFKVGAGGFMITHLEKSP